MTCLKKKQQPKLEMAYDCFIETHYNLIESLCLSIPYHMINNYKIWCKKGKNFILPSTHGFDWINMLLVEIPVKSKLSHDLIPWNIPIYNILQPCQKARWSLRKSPMRFPKSFPHTTILFPYWVIVYYILGYFMGLYLGGFNTMIFWSHIYPNIQTWDPNNPMVGSKSWAQIVPLQPALNPWRVRPGNPGLQLSAS